ncbi:hypothetical protein LF1_19630 [Rubripirellula obstinata]|uniref:Uncharacterized protein n=2 Tax=Rubripirellula obstinata TaxID=406547 RepID=A0A5B1CGU2_9BACT|nr:hypothetical protein LF1_19630 [Rubripirellula obstinata]
MRVRHGLSLPLVAGDDDDPIANDVEQQFEAGLLDACREAGIMLIQDGKIGEGWMYLRPLADNELANQLLSKVEITDDNYDEMIHILLHEGVDVRRGYRAVLDHQGTCNSITLFDQAIVGRSKQDRQAAAGELLDHFYSELTSMVRDDVSQRDKDHPELQNQDGSWPKLDDQTLGDLVAARKWLLQDGVYHLDTTHLSAVVRNAAVLDDEQAWQKARELVAYGRRLHHEFQYPGDEPFVDFYPAYAAYYDVLLGTHVDAGLNQFKRKAETVDSDQHGTSAIETYVDLLHRIGRHSDAISEAIRLVPDDVPSQQIVPLLLDYASHCQDTDAYQPIADYCKKQNDVLGFTAVMHAMKA